MSLLPYPKYKPSGVEWIGEVPEHWEVGRLKDYGMLFAGTGFPHEHQGSDRETLPFYKVGDLIESSNGRHLGIAPNTVSYETATKLRAHVIPKGAIVYAKIGAALFLNRRRITTVPCCIDNNMTAYIPEKLEPKWAFYWTNILDFGVYANPGAIPSLSEGDQVLLPIAAPSGAEQHAIAAFLDRETEKIDTLVAKKRTLIERLKEERTALITHTVTRGLPPEAARAAGLEPHPKLKSSGVEWLGEVPEHWEVKRGRFCADVNPQPLRSLHPDSEASFVPMEAVGEYGGLNLDQTRYVFEVNSGYTEFKDGDVVVAKITPCFENGKGALATGLLNGIGFGTTELHVLRPFENLDVRFLFYFSISQVFRNMGEGEMYGAGGQKRVPPEFCKDIQIPLPPVEEQHAIADFLDRATVKIDTLMTKIETAIERLQEYRSALITAAVTGKIDVREKADL